MEKATVRMQVENDRKTVLYFHPVRIAQVNAVARNNATRNYVLGGRTPKQSRKRIIDHLCQVLPDVERSRIEKLI